MTFKLDVPFVSQLGYGADGQMDDPTGCWYASACMLAYFFEAGPRQGVPELHTSNLDAATQGHLGFTGHFATGSADAHTMMQLFGGGQSEHDLLAKRENLTPVAQCETGHAFTTDEIENLLRKQGPIFFYWMKTSGGNTYGHASLIYGINSAPANILYHDPENETGLP